MVKKTRLKAKRRNYREALVYNHLEMVSRDLFEEHPDLVRQFIGRNAGVYALYRKGELYYVGLATGLRGRLKAHAKNRHGNSWDRFSIYLTVKDQHLREIESLLLRIANPPGARQRGKLFRSKDMRGWIAKEIRKKQKERISDLFQKYKRIKEVVSRKLHATSSDSELIRLLPRGARLRGMNRGKSYRASVRPDGRVRYNGTYFRSLSQAAAAALKRPTNGWWFWEVKRAGVWVRMKNVRNAGNPVYPR